MKVKIIVYDGVVDAVLTDGTVPVDVEVISVDKDYPDYRRLSEYRDSLCNDPQYTGVDYKVASFED